MSNSVGNVTSVSASDFPRLLVPLRSRLTSPSLALADFIAFFRLTALLCSSFDRTLVDLAFYIPLQQLSSSNLFIASQHRHLQPSPSTWLNASNQLWVSRKPSTYKHRSKPSKCSSILASALCAISATSSLRKHSPTNALRLPGKRRGRKMGSTA